MAKRQILANDRRCSGCMLCLLSCSLVNFGVINPDKTFIRLLKNDGTQSFTISIDKDCKSCGECVRACAYNVLGWEDENSRN